MQHNNTLNPLVVHCKTFEHNFDLINASLIRKVKDSLTVKSVENILISQFSTIYREPGSYLILPMRIAYSPIIAQCDFTS